MSWLKIHCTCILVQSITTDRHTYVGALRKRQYPTIYNQYDVLHLAKSIVKKLTKTGKTKKMLPWIHSISNHLWWSAQTCEGNPDLLCAKWTSIVYHITNVHQWDGNGLFDHCAHDTLSPDEEQTKGWLEPNGPALIKIKVAVGHKKNFQIFKILAHWKKSSFP